MSSNIQAVVDFDGLWYTWTPSGGPLTIEFEDAQFVRTLWFPIMPYAVSFSATPTPLHGNPFYIANGTGLENGPEIVPLPQGTDSVTMTGTTAQLVYLYASSYAFNPFKGAAVNYPQGGEFDITFGADGTVSYELAFPTGYTSLTSISFTPDFESVTPAAVTWGADGKGWQRCDGGIRWRCTSFDYRCYVGSVWIAMSKKLKIAFVLFALLTGTAVAVPQIYHGSLQVPSGGFIQDTNQASGYAHYSSNGTLTATALPSQAPVPCPTASSNIAISGTLLPACSIAAVVPCPTAGANITITGSALPNCAFAAATSSPAPVVPCPTPSSNITITGTDMPNCAFAAVTPTPAPTPSPMATGCGVISGSWPYLIDTSGCATGAALPIYDNNNSGAPISGGLIIVGSSSVPTNGQYPGLTTNVAFTGGRAYSGTSYKVICQVTNLGGWSSAYSYQCFPHDTGSIDIDIQLQTSGTPTFTVSWQTIGN